MGERGQTRRGGGEIGGLLHVEAVRGLSREACGGGGVAVAGVRRLGSHRSGRGGQHQLLT